MKNNTKKNRANLYHRFRAAGAPAAVAIDSARFCLSVWKAAGHNDAGAMAEQVAAVIPALMMPAGM